MPAPNWRIGASDGQRNRTMKRNIKKNIHDNRKEIQLRTYKQKHRTK